MREPPTEFSKTNPKQFFSGVIWGQISRLGDIGLSFLFSILVIRLLGKTEYGHYSTILNLISFVTIFIGFGFSETLNRYLPEVRAATKPFPISLLRHFLAIRVISALLAGTVLYLISGWLSDWLQDQTIVYLGWLLFLMVVPFSLSDLLNNYYVASFQLKLIFLVRSATQLIGLVSILIWFQFAKPEAIIPLVVLALTLGVQCLIYLKYLPAHELFKVTSVPKDRLAPIYRYSRDLWFITLCTYALAGQFDVLALAFLLKDPVQVAYYSLVTLILARIHSLVTGWSTSNISVFSTVYTQQGKIELSRYFIYYYKLNLLTMLPAIGGVFAVANGLIPLIFGTEFSPAVPLVWVYIIHLAISTICGAGVTYNLLLTLNRQNSSLGWRIFFSIANIILDILLIPMLGALGAIIASGISNTSLHFVELWLVRDMVNKFPWAFFLKLISAIMLSVGFGLVATSLIQSNLWSTIVGSVVFVVILLGILLVLKPFEASDLALTRRWLPKLANKLRYLTHGG